MKTSKQIFELVLTGGPCSGKTTALSYLQSWLSDRGFRVLIVPEVATMLIMGGLHDIGKIANDRLPLYLNVQKEILRIQLVLRQRYLNLAENFDEPVVILYDRGPMDSKPYLPSPYFEDILKEEKLELKDVRDVYTAVIHLVTAANGAEAYYTTSNNKARSESPEQARILDEATRDAWDGHTHLRSIDNSTGFDEKMNRLIAVAARSLGIPVPIEIERKFLLKNFNLDEIRKHVHVVDVEIEQIYIQHPLDGKSRIRKRTASDGSSTYYYTVKTATGSFLVRYERERHITLNEYTELQSLREPDRYAVRKTRHCFVWKSQYFELDTFESPVVEPMLETELTEETDQIIFPPFIEIDREVTDEPAYSNYSLAKLPPANL